MVKKFKTSRYLNQDIYGIGSKVTVKNTLKKSKPSAYSHKEILIESQKLKKAHGITNKQFKKYVHEAKKHKDHLSLNLNSILGSRLDNCVKEITGIGSILQAKQNISHGHSLVNGKVVNSGSFKVKPGDSLIIGNITKTNSNTSLSNRWTHECYGKSYFFVGTNRRQLNVKDDVYSFFGSRNRAR